MIKIIMISNNTQFDREIFRQIQSSSLSIEKLVFSPYTKLDITIIITNMLKHHGLDVYFDKAALCFLCEKSASNGDIRKAISNTKTVLLSYLQDKKVIESLGDLIDFKYVNSKLKLIGEEIINAMKSLTNEQKLVLMSIYQLMKRDNELIDFYEKDIFDQYKIIKKTKIQNEMSNRLFDENLTALCENGIIEKKATTKTKKVYRMIRYTYNDLNKIYEDDTLFKILNE